MNLQELLPSPGARERPVRCCPSPPVQRFGDRSPERSLPHTRGSYQAQDGAFAVRNQGPHSDIFDDPPLHLCIKERQGWGAVQATKHRASARYSHGRDSKVGVGTSKLHAKCHIGPGHYCPTRAATHVHWTFRQHRRFFQLRDCGRQDIGPDATHLGAEGISTTTSGKNMPDSFRHRQVEGRWQGGGSVHHPEAPCQSPPPLLIAWGEGYSRRTIDGNMIVISISIHQIGD